VNRSTNAIRYTDLNDVVILAEDTDGKKMAADTIVGLNTYKCETQFLSPASEALFGLGCHPLDSLAMNYKGRNQEYGNKIYDGRYSCLVINQWLRAYVDNYAASNFYGAEQIIRSTNMCLKAE